MQDANGKVLYVGQSTNLRSRLNSYKNAHPDHVSRKVIRLVHEVRKIGYEECVTPERARLRENELLRSLRPKFNRMNTFPKAHCFIGLEHRPGTISLSLTREELAGAHYFGAFKSGAVHAYAALLRLLWAAMHRPLSVDAYPRQLLLARPPSRFDLEFSGSGLEARGRTISAPPPQEVVLLAEFLRGESICLKSWLEERLDPGTCLFHQQMVAADLEVLEHFYDFGPCRNKALKDHHRLPGELILQEELDDQLVTDLWRTLRPQLYPPEPEEGEPEPLL